MRSLRTYIILVLTMLLMSCEKVLQVSITEEKPVLVVEGWLTNRREAHQIRLYYTSPVMDNTSPVVAKNATVILKDNAGNSEKLKEVSGGSYEIRTIRGREGRTYTLSVLFEGSSYEAVSTMPRLSMAADTLEFKYKKKQLLYPADGFYPFITGQELRGAGDYTWYKLFRNGKFLNKSSEINLFSDKYVDGNRIGNYELEIDSPFVSGDHIRVEAWSLNEATYNMMTDIREQLNNNGLFASPLPNARSNIRKLDPNSEDVTGFFGTSMVQAIERTVP
ncbi:MAG: DUF4249 domain-containing protein [Arcticibacter sp.]